MMLSSDLIQGVYTWQEYHSSYAVLSFILTDGE